jgi:hypothetical protein
MNDDQRYKLNDSYEVTADVHPERTGNCCPDCGEPEWKNCIHFKTEGWRNHHGNNFSCIHYHKRWLDEILDPICNYCGKRGGKVRQVPAMVPVSDCYCDDCADKCRDEYQPVRDAMVEHQRNKVLSN